MVDKKKKSTTTKGRTSPRRASSLKKYNTILKEMQAEHPDAQATLILKHILEHGGITPKEAERKPIYSMRLSARVYELRHDYNIPIEIETTYKKRGKKLIPNTRYYIKGVK